MSKEDDLLGKQFLNKYTLKQKLGEGSFGSIYLSEYEGEEYALKFEKKSKGQDLLKNEGYIMSYLKGGKIEINKYRSNTICEINRQLR